MGINWNAAPVDDMMVLEFHAGDGVAERVKESEREEYRRQRRVDVNIVGTSIVSSMSEDRLSHWCTTQHGYSTLSLLECIFLE